VLRLGGYDWPSPAPVPLSYQQARALMGTAAPRLPMAPPAAAAAQTAPRSQLRAS